MFITMTTIQHKRGIAANWTSSNPVLSVAEIGYETDTGKFKIGDGASAWSALPYFSTSAGGSGTVTSVDLSVPTGLSVSGNPVTTSGTLAISFSSGYAIPTTAKQTEWDTAYTDRLKWDGGSTGLDAATARTSLGLVIGTNVQAYDADLAGIASATLSSAGFLKTNGSGVYSTVTDSSSNWNTAYGWGNHASAGYLTSLGIGSSTQAWDADLDAVAALSGTGLAKRTGAGTWTTITDSSTDWNTAYTDRLKWDGGSSGLTASTGRTSLGATTVGSNIFTLANPSATTFLKINADNSITTENASTHLASLGATTVGENLLELTNPSAIRFIRINANNTVSALSDADFRTAIGAGTGSGTVTTVSVATANGFAGTVANATTTPAITISTSVTGLLSGNGTAISAASTGYGDTTNPYGSKTTNYVLAGPAGGPSAAPSFRALVSADIPDLSGTYLAVGATAASATSADTVKTVSTATNASFYPVFVDANNGTATAEALYTDAGLIYNPSSNQLSTGGDISVNGGDLLTNQTTFNLINTTATTLNIGGAATTMAIGATGSTVSFPGKISVTASSGDEGGEIFLASPATNTTITNGVTVDVYQNRLRFFEQGGSARGYYLDITEGGGSASTNIRPPMYMKLVQNSTQVANLAGGTAGTVSAFGTNGVALKAGTAYEVEMVLFIESVASSNSCTLIITPGSPSSPATPSSTELYYDYSSSTTVMTNAAALSGVRRTGTTTFPALNTITVATGTTNYFRAFMKGIVDVDVAGNFTIRLAYTPGAGGSMVATVLAGSYLKITELGTEDITDIGTWA
jgi:Major tropism determinant N-terminal domain